ncbi:MAG: heparinase II/III family protein [Planctomycetota bacterium]|nr:heparinase II/III family protein [Planctomycetota bacterium]
MDEPNRWQVVTLFVAGRPAPRRGRSIGDGDLPMETGPSPHRDRLHLSRRRFLEFTGAAALLTGLSACESPSSRLVGDADSHQFKGHARAHPMVVSFDFGCAAGLYAKGLHPRLLLNPEDLDRLRTACRSGWCQLALAGLRRKVEPLVQRVLDSPDLSATATQPAGKQIDKDPKLPGVAAHLPDLALVGLLDHDARALDAARLAINSGPAHYGNSALAYDLLQPHLSSAERAQYVAWASAKIPSYLELAGPRYIQCAGGNTPIGYMLHALELVLAIGGDEGAPDLTRQRQSLLLDFEAAIYSAIGPEGYPAEDIGYGTMVAGKLLEMAMQLRRAGLYDAYTRCPRLALFGRAMLHFVQPWGMFLSNTGDHGDDFRDRSAALATLARFHNDPTLTWLLTTLSYPCLDPEFRDRIAPLDHETPLGPGMQAPTNAVTLITLADVPAPVLPQTTSVPTAFKDSDRGIVSFRSGWRDDDTFVYFDGSQRPGAAPGHAHDSAGHFCLSAVGEYFAVSPGRYGNEQDQHNTLLVDGKSGWSNDGQWGATPYQGRLIEYRPNELCDYAAADCSKQTNCYWSFRHLGLIKGGEAPAYAWTVDDVNGANDYRSFWWTMYSAPGNTIRIQGNQAQIEGKRHGGILDVHFAVPPPECYPKPHAVEVVQDMPWTSSHKYVSRDWVAGRRHNGVHHATFERPRLVAKVTGFNGQVMAVMIPRRKGEPAAIVEPLPTLMGALAMRIVRGHIEDTLIFAYGHSLLEANGVRGRGRWLVVRRDQRDRRLVSHAIHRGDWLEVDGQSVKL